MVAGRITSEGRRVLPSGDGDAIFEVPWLNELFTSLLLTDMALRGEVALTDPVAKYVRTRLPEPQGRAIELLDVATHTSGLPTADVDLADYELARDTGSAWEYSKAGLALLSNALTMRAGLDFTELVRMRISRPLRMRNTSVGQSSMND